MNGTKNEFGTYSKEVALILDISTSNLRKWSLLLEEEGYEFARNDNNQRIYYDCDINVLSQLKNLLKKNRNIDDAIKAVLKRVKEKNSAEIMLSAINQKGGEITIPRRDFEEFKESIQMVLSTQEKLIRGYQETVFKLQEERKALPSTELVKEAVQSALNEQDKEYNTIIKEYQALAQSLRNEIEEQKKEFKRAETNKEQKEKDELRLRLNFRREAIQEWNKKPVEERMIKTGFMKKEEDKIKRDDFIQDYIAIKMLESYEKES